MLDRELQPPTQPRANVYPIGVAPRARWSYQLSDQEQKVARLQGRMRDETCNPDYRHTIVEHATPDELKTNNRRAVGAEIAGSRIFNVSHSGCCDGRVRPGKPHVYDIGDCCEVRVITEWRKGLLCQAADLDDAPILLMHYDVAAQVFSALGFEFAGEAKRRGVHRTGNSREGYWTLERGLLRSNEELADLFLQFKMSGRA